MLAVTEVIVALTDPIQRKVRVVAAGLCLLVALVAWPADTAQAALVKVTAVTLQEVATELQVSIATSGPARYQQRNVRANWVVVDILGAELGIPAGKVPLSGGPISQIRVGQFASDVVRVVVELAQPMRTHLASSVDATGIIVGILARNPSSQSPGVAALPSDSVRGGIAKITGIALWGTASKPWVSITASAPVRYQLRDVEPDWVVMDVSRAQLALESGKPPVGRGVVKQIRVGQFAPDVVRVVLELTQHVPIHIATSPDKAAIVVNFVAEVRTPGGSTPVQRDDRVPPSSVQPPAASPPPAASAASPQPPAGGQPGGNSEPGRPPVSTPEPVVSPPPASAPQNAVRPSGDDYLLGPEDVLEITVWGYPDLGRILPVRPDGQVTVPLAGTIPAAGRSAEQLTQVLTRAFAKYIINPQVTVIVKDFRKVRVSLLGQVARPGTYTLPPGARLLDAISIASGVTDNAALPQAKLVRASGETRPLNLDAVLLQQDMSHNLILEPGDTIILPEDTTNKFYVVGDVNHVGIFPLKGDVTVLQAIAMAGGPVLHGTSTSGTVHIVRRVGPGQGPVMAGVQRADAQPIANGNGVLLTKDLHAMMRGDLRQNEALRPGDVIVVPAPGVVALQTILGFLPFLWWFGVHP